MFALIVQQRGALWYAAAFYDKRSGAVSVCHSWHLTRAEAVAALAWHF